VAAWLEDRKGDFAVSSHGRGTLTNTVNEHVWIKLLSKNRQ